MAASKPTTRAGALGGAPVAAHEIFKTTGGETAIEGLLFQANSCGVRLQVGIAQSAFRRLFVDIVVIGPEGILLRSALAGLSSQDRSLPQEGKMDIAEPHLARIHILLLNLTTRVSGKYAAERSLEIGKLFDEHGRVGIAAIRPSFRGKAHRGAIMRGGRWVSSHHFWGGDRYRGICSFRGSSRFRGISSRLVFWGRCRAG